MSTKTSRRRPRIGRLPYLSAAPFYFDWEIDENSFEVIVAPPRQLAHLASRGDIDAACFSLTDVFRLQRAFEPLGTLGIATAESGVPPGPLFHARVDETLLGRASIGIPNESTLAPALLNILLREVFKVQVPEHVPLTPDRRQLGGLLFVGDAAIDAIRKPPRGFDHVQNLAVTWQKWTNLPLVFGRWMVRKEMLDDHKKQLEQVISSALARAATQLEQVAAAYLQASALDWELEVATHILREFTYNLGSIHQQSIDRFRRELRPKRQRTPIWLQDAAFD